MMDDRETVLTGFQLVRDDLTDEATIGVLDSLEDALLKALDAVTEIRATVMRSAMHTVSDGVYDQDADMGYSVKVPAAFKCEPDESCGAAEPTDDEIYNGPGVEGGIAYDTTADEPGSLGENDWRL